MNTPNGAMFVDDIIEHIKDADLIVAILSPAYFKSEFCLAEVGATQLRQKTQKGVSFSLLVPPANFADHLKGILHGVQSGRINVQGDLDELHERIKRKATNPPPTATWNEESADFLKKVQRYLNEQAILQLLDRLTIRETVFERSASVKTTYKLKLRIEIRNDTGKEIRVRKPSWWDSQYGSRMKYLGNSLQLLVGGKWDPHEAGQITVPAGGVFRFWLAFEPEDEANERHLKELRKNNRLGSFALPVSIAGSEGTWRRSI